MSISLFSALYCIGQNELLPGEILQRGHILCFSNQYYLSMMQENGNLVTYIVVSLIITLNDFLAEAKHILRFIIACLYTLQGTREAIWESGTGNNAGYATVTETRFAICGKSGNILWWRDSSGKVDKLVLQDSGTLVLMGTDGDVMWASTWDF